jgi:Zn finger protein HypA/HybF involved in hydrogenase expression
MKKTFSIQLDEVQLEVKCTNCTTIITPDSKMAVETDSLYLCPTCHKSTRIGAVLNAWKNLIGLNVQFRVDEV